MFSPSKATSTEETGESRKSADSEYPNAWQLPVADNEAAKFAETLHLYGFPGIRNISSQIRSSRENGALFDQPEERMWRFSAIRLSWINGLHHPIDQ